MPMPTEIPTLAPSSTNRQVRSITRPEGIPQAHHFALAEDSLPEAAEGQFRMSNIYLSVDPAQHGWASSEAN